MLAETVPAPPTQPTPLHLLAPVTRRPAGNQGLATGLLARPLGAALLLLTAVFTIYLPSLNGQFLWDDNSLVKGNYLIRSPLFCLEVFRHTLFNDDSNFYRPTQTLTFMADYWCGGLDPFVYHLTSVLIHAANAVLLCLTLRRILPELLRGALDRRQVNLLALGIALVWAVHPVHSAAVAYISGTADTLAMTCCLLGFLLAERAFVAARPLPRAAWSAGAVGCLLLGLCAKEIASVWLLLFLGYLFFLRADTSRRARWTVVALATATLGIYLALRHLTPVPPTPPPLPPMPSKPVLILRALGDYGSLLLFPAKLFMERQVFAAPGLANAEDETFYHTLACTGALVLAAFAAGCWWRGRGQTLRRAGVAWFLVGFLPISNLFALNASVAEHWLYLPSIGFLLFLVGVGLDLPLLLPPRRAGIALLVGTACVAGALGLRTWLRTFDWTDELTFFRQTIADGGDVFRARAGLAVAFQRRGIDNGDAAANDRGIAVLRELVKRSPKAVAPRINLGLSLARKGDEAQAKIVLDGVAADLLAGGTRDPREIVTLLKGLGQLDRDDPAWPERQGVLLTRGLQQFPHTWELVKYGVEVREQGSQLPEALAMAQRFADAHWWHAPARYTVGLVQARMDRPADALATWAEASRLDVHDAEALSSAAALCLQTGQPGEAHELQARAVRRQPDSPRQHVLFAKVLAQQGDARAAAAQVALAKSLVEQADGGQ